jgi:hypothetical protein
MKKYEDALYEAIQIRENIGDLIEEPDCICIIHSGEAVVYNAE